MYIYLKGKKKKKKAPMVKCNTFLVIQIKAQLKCEAV